MRIFHAAGLVVIGLSLLAVQAQAATHDTPSRSQIIKESKPAEWHALDPADTLYMYLPKGIVVIDLAPSWSPRHVANLKTLVREHYFDGTSVYRVVDNFVVQWGDPDAGKPNAKSMGEAKKTLPPEFERRVTPSMPFVKLDSPDAYAPEVGLSGDFPVGVDPTTHTAWIAHCYGTVGVSRDVALDSGNSNTLYAVIGTARRIDRNLAVVGRIVQGMPLLSSLPRGPGDSMGVYHDMKKATPILRVRLASEVPKNQRLPLEILDTGSATFHRLVQAAAHRHDAFYRTPLGHIGLCAALPPVRLAPGAKEKAASTTGK